MASMAGDESRVDQIVRELIERGGSKEQRVALLRELVRRGEELPEAMLQSALQKLMERLGE
ncbi:MAG: hypothetical protein H6836_00255 [Planctomycetes bacterium]|nr:hypothetical protein [Planctomycetota bacterium]MCB9887972.1 hypothetical protein [Planctomycetota bacterium]